MEEKNTVKNKRKSPVFSIILLVAGLSFIVYSLYGASQRLAYYQQDSTWERTFTDVLFGGSELTFCFICGSVLIALSAIAFAWRFKKPKDKVIKPVRGYTPVRSYSENTGSAKIDAINAQYNARMRQATSDLAFSTGEKPKSAASAMVKGAVVGKLIGGDGGAVVGAMVAKEKHDQKNK